MHIYTACRQWKAQQSKWRFLHAWIYEYLGTCDTKRCEYGEGLTRFLARSTQQLARALSMNFLAWIYIGYLVWLSVQGINSCWVS